MRRRSGKTLRSAARAALRVVLAVALVLSLAVAVGVGLGPHTGEYRVLTVLSDSMRPTFAAGDMIVVTPERSRDLRAGQAITFHRPDNGSVITHRVVSVVWGGDRPVVRTQGDASSRPDRWKARLNGDVVWRQRAAIPKLGWILTYLREPWLRALTVYALPALLALLWLIHIWTPHRPRTGAARGEPSRVGAGAL